MENITLIQPTRGLASLQLRAMWQYRELLYFLVWRDVKVRYKQTVLGVFWVLVQPLLTTVVFTLLFGILLKVPSGDSPYPVFCQLPQSLFRQPGGKRQPDHQSLLPPPDHSCEWRAVGPGGFRGWVCDHGRTDGGVQDQANAGRCAVARLYAAGHRCGIGYGPVAVCLERALPGCQTSGALPGADMDVFDTGNLSRYHHPQTATAVLGAESDDGRG
jgi:hypothetical protein